MRSLVILAELVQECANPRDFAHTFVPIPRSFLRGIFIQELAELSSASSCEIYNYGFPQSLPNRRDVALVVLDQPIQLSEYGKIPDAGFLDSLAAARGTKNVLFTASGYGLRGKQEDHNGKPNETYRERLMALSALVNVRSALSYGFNLQTVGNSAGKGGTCNGDSGGPVFWGNFESNLIVAVTSFGLNELCRGTDFAYRIDQPDVLAWLAEHMYLP